MPGTRTTSQLSGGGVAVQLDQVLTAIGVTDWVYLTSRVELQCTGVATAVTVQVERSTVDPTGTANPAPVGAAASGNPATGMAVATYDEAGAAWWRARLTALTGASVAISISGRGAATPAAILQDRAIPPKLARLRLSTSLATAGTNFSADVLGATTGSELRLSRNPGGRWALTGTVLSGKGLASGIDTPAITELPGTSGALAPRETEFDVKVAHNPSVPAFTRPWAVALPTLSLSGNLSGPEGDSGTTAYPFSATISAPAPAGGLVVPVTFSPGSTSPSDYPGGVYPSLTSVTIPAGQTSVAIPINASGDTTVEADESFTVVLGAVAGYTLLNSGSTGTILNDDTGAAVLSLTGPLTYAAGASAGSLVANIGNVPSGVTPTLTPNDGRMVIAGDATNGWKVVIGLSASTPGTIALAVAATGATGASGSVTVSVAAGTSPTNYSAAGITPAVSYHPHSQAANVTKVSGRVVGCPDLRGLAALSGYAADGTTPVGPWEMTDKIDRKFWRFNGSVSGNSADTDLMYATIANTLTGVSNRGFMVIAVVRSPHAVSVPFLMPRFSAYTNDAANTAANGSIGYLRQTATSQGAPGLASSSPAAITNTADAYKAIPGTGLQVICVASRTTANGGIRYYVNNEVCDVAQATTLATGLIGGIIGALPGASNTANVSASYLNAFDLYALDFFTGEYTNTQSNAAVAAAVANYDRPTAYTVNFLVGGDSTIDGVPTTLATSPAKHGAAPSQMTEPGAELVPKYVRVVNIGASGSTTSNEVARRDAASAMSTMLMPNGPTKNIYAFQLGLNDCGESIGKKNSAMFYADAKALIYTASTGYLQRGWKCFMIGNTAGPATAVTTNVSPAGENNTQKRLEAYRALIADTTNHVPNPTFLNEVEAGSGQTYAGLVGVIHAYDITIGGAQPFKTSPGSGQLAPSGPYDSDLKHLVAEGYALFAKGGDTPQYGLASAFS